MKLLRRRVRGFFALQTMVMVVTGSMKLTGSFSQSDVSSAWVHFSAALMFLGAWWTTRKPSPYRNSWAMAASLICVATGAYIVWAAHARGRFSQSGWLSVLLGVAGLYLFSQGERPRKQLLVVSAS